MTTEKVFTYGERHHGIGVVSEPEQTENSPVVVMLNAGLSHRAEPYRLNVLLGRKLAALGYIALRVDLSGKGDSPARETISNRESVARDWSFIKASLEKMYGTRTIIISGLCSGADNAIKICARDTDVKGLILLDPVSRQDAGFKKRDILRKVTNVNKWRNIGHILARRLKHYTSEDDSLLSSPTALRDEPNTQDVDQCFERLVQDDGRVFAVFTSQTLYHYNKHGQFASAMGIAGVEQVIEEEFWPNAKHIFPIEAHRTRLINAIGGWAEKHLNRFQNLSHL